MTVEELIATLKNMPQDALVVSEISNKEYEEVYCVGYNRAEKIGGDLWEYLNGNEKRTTNSKIIDVVVLI